MVIYICNEVAEFKKLIQISKFDDLLPNENMYDYCAIHNCDYVPHLSWCTSFELVYLI